MELRRPDLLDTIRFEEVEAFPPLAEIDHGRLFALSLSTNTTTFTHGLHRFAAKYVPQVPAWALDTFGSRAAVVLDPFMGSGTTLVEGVQRGGTSIGVDIDPLARFIARAKVTPVDHERITALAAELADRWRTPAATLQPPMPDIDELRPLVQPDPVGLGAVAAGRDPHPRLHATTSAPSSWSCSVRPCAGCRTPTTSRRRPTCRARSRKTPPTVADVFWRFLRRAIARAGRPQPQAPQRVRGDHPR